MALRSGIAVVVLGLLVVILVGVFFVARRAHVRNFLDPKSPVFVGSGTNPSPQAPGGDFHLSVVSFNVHFGYATAEIAPTLRANGMDTADILLLQESNEVTTREVAAALGAGYVYYPAAVHPTSKDLFGVAILSRWPIRAHRKILLPDRTYFDAARKAAVTAVIETSSGLIQVVNVHLQSGLLRRGYEAQLRSLLACALRNTCDADRTPAPLPPASAVVIGGDFNTWHGGLVTALMSSMAAASLQRVEGIEDTFSKSLSESAPRFTFDYFFTSPHLLPVAGRVGTLRTGSDHFPIEATFRFR